MHSEVYDLMIKIHFKAEKILSNLVYWSENQKGFPSFCVNLPKDKYKSVLSLHQLLRDKATFIDP